MEIEKLYQLFKESTGISTDSKSVKKDNLFIGIEGEKFNGGKFAQQAIDNGAKYAIVNDNQFQTDKKILVVEDTLKALQALANRHRKALKIPVLAITGTNGKTTTKELIAKVLSKKFNLHYTQGNLNNHIGVPLTLLSIDKNVEMAIVEMGANHAGEIAQLCLIAEPDYGVITNIGKAHLEGFGSFEKIIATKGELFDYLKTYNGLAFVNGNDKNTLLLGEPIKKKMIYGLPGSDIQLAVLSKKGLLKVAIKSAKEECVIQSNLIGNYNKNNILTAASIGHYFGITLSQIQEAIESYVPTNNRSQLIETNKYHIVMDAYNANPTSMQTSIESFVESFGNNCCLILGDMLELGDNACQEHEKIVALVEKLNVTHPIFIGEEFLSVSTQKFKKFADVHSLNEFLSKQKPQEPAILIKGSRGIQLEKCLNQLIP